MTSGILYMYIEFKLLRRRLSHCVHPKCQSLYTELHDASDQAGVRLTSSTDIRKVPGSNIGRNTGNAEGNSLGFLQYLQWNFGESIFIESEPHPPGLFSIYRSVIVLPSVP
jgi:hypothetical protein